MDALTVIFIVIIAAGAYSFVKLQIAEHRRARFWKKVNEAHRHMPSGANVCMNCAHIVLEGQNGCPECGYAGMPWLTEKRPTKRGPVKEAA